MKSAQHDLRHVRMRLSQFLPNTNNMPVPSSKPASGSGTDSIEKAMLSMPLRDWKGILMVVNFSSTFMPAYTEMSPATLATGRFGLSGNVKYSYDNGTTLLFTRNSKGLP